MVAGAAAGQLALLPTADGGQGQDQDVPATGTSSASATQLGKALEEPVQGITALRRVGVSFTASQRELIQSLVETGPERPGAEGHSRHPGAAGRWCRCGRGGRAHGAANRLADAWGNLPEAIGQTPVVSGTEGALGLPSRAMARLTTFLDEQPITERIVGANNELIAAENELARLQAGGLGMPLIGQRQFLAEQEAKVATLRQEVDALVEAEKLPCEPRTAEASRCAAEALREEGLRLVEATRTPTKDHAASVARLNGLLQAGAIDQETYNRAPGDAAGDLAGAQHRLLRQSRDWQAGVRLSPQDYVDAAVDATSAAEAATPQVFATMEDALVSFATPARSNSAR